jgi:hypothetical protein
MPMIGVYMAEEEFAALAAKAKPSKAHHQDGKREESVSIFWFRTSCRAFLKLSRTARRR